MLLFPHPVSSHQFASQFAKIEILAQAARHVPLSSDEKNHFFHQQLLKSSLFSARIEGNHGKSISEKLELSNILQAQDFIKKQTQALSREELKQIHSLILKNISAEAGRFRHEPSAIFDSFGNVVYLTPSPPEMQNMLDIFLAQSNQHSNWLNDLISSAFCHYYFEKIHPFIDGNGRVGRILLAGQLQNSQTLKDLILPIEEYFSDNRTTYYFHLEKNTRQLGAWVKFFLDGIIWSLEKYLADIKVSKEKSVSHLPPRRQEILEIIKDHPYINLDGIARRFPTIPHRTIAYDVQQLTKKNLVNKHGETRGVCYSAGL